MSANASLPTRPCPHGQGYREFGNRIRCRLHSDGRFHTGGQGFATSATVVSMSATSPMTTTAVAGGTVMAVAPVPERGMPAIASAASGDSGTTRVPVLETG